MLKNLMRKKQGKTLITLALHERFISILALTQISKGEASTKPHFVVDSIPYQVIVNTSELLVDNLYDKALVRLLDSLSDLKLKNAELQIVLSSAFVELATVDKPNVPEDDIASSLQWSLGELVSIPALDLILDYYDPPVKGASGNQINVVAVSRKFIEKLVLAAHDFGVRIKGVSFADFSLSLALQRSQPTLLLYQMPKERAVFSIIANNKLVLNRTLRQSYDLVNMDVTDMDIFEDLAVDIQRSLDFYSNQLQQLPVTQISLLVPHKDTESFATALATYVGIPTVAFSYPQWMADLQLGDLRDALTLAGCAHFSPVLEANTLDAETDTDSDNDKGNLETDNSEPAVQEPYIDERSL